MPTVAERVAAAVAPVLEGLDLVLHDVEHAGTNIRVVIDRDGGVDVDALTAATRAVSRLLDELDPIDGHYTLEVSSPGLERTLRTPAHFRKYVGATISVKTNPEVEGDRRVQGGLEAADDDGITVAGRRIAYDQIAKARTVFEWGPTPKPVGAPPRTKKKAVSR